MKYSRVAAIRLGSVWFCAEFQFTVLGISLGFVPQNIIYILEFLNKESFFQCALQVVKLVRQL